MSQSYSVVIVNCFLTSGMGIVCENTNFCSSETDFLPEMFVATGKKRGVQKIGSIGFSSAVSTRETFGAHSCMVVTCLSCFNYEQSGLLLLFLQAGISTECSHSNMLPSIHAMFRQEKGNVSKVLKDSPCQSLMFLMVVKSLMTVAALICGSILSTRKKITQSPLIICQQSTIARHEQLQVNAISVVTSCNMAEHHIMILYDAFRMSECKNVQCL